MVSPDRKDGLRKQILRFIFWIILTFVLEAAVLPSMIWLSGSPRVVSPCTIISSLISTGLISFIVIWHWKPGKIQIKAFLSFIYSFDLKKILIILAAFSIGNILITKELIAHKKFCYFCNRPATTNAEYYSVGAVYFCKNHPPPPEIYVPVFAGRNSLCNPKWDWFIIESLCFALLAYLLSQKISFGFPLAQIGYSIFIILLWPMLWWAFWFCLTGVSLSLITSAILLNKNLQLKRL